MLNISSLIFNFDLNLSLFSYLKYSWISGQIILKLIYILLAEKKHKTVDLAT